jgi:hypothetical protein
MKESTGPPAPTEACITTPTSPRGDVVSFRNGVVNALYTTQTLPPVGEIAGAT